MSILVDHQIIEAVKKGDIIIDPFRTEYLGPNSYDLHIGPQYYTENKTEKTTRIDTYSDDLWRGPHSAFTTNDHYNGIYVLPQSMILAHTIERIGTPNKIVTSLRGKSTIARLGLSVEFAGLGDIGFISQWTLEIRNHTRRTWIIPVWYPIVQAVFEDSVEPQQRYYLGHKGNYGMVPMPEGMLPVVKKRT